MVVVDGGSREEEVVEEREVEEDEVEDVRVEEVVALEDRLRASNVRVTPSVVTTAVLDLDAGSEIVTEPMTISVALITIFLPLSVTVAVCDPKLKVVPPMTTASSLLVEVCGICLR